MVSVVVPVYNEEESVRLLHEELLEVLTGLTEPFEVIYIDDGSTDGTLAELRQLQGARVVAFTRNFGKSQALSAGFEAAQGDRVFTIDGDLQDDPKEIPAFLAKMRESRADVVCGWKQERKDSAAKRLVSRVANALTRFFTDTAVHDMNCGYKLFTREAAQALDLYGDMHRYIPAQVAALGFRVTELPVAHRPRKFGISKYGNFRRFFKSAFDFITLLLLRRFTDRPMHLFGIAGTFLSFIGVLILGYLAYLKIFFAESIGSRPLLLLGVLLVVIGLQLFTSGFLGELIIRQRTSRRVYKIREERS